MKFTPLVFTILLFNLLAFKNLSGHETWVSPVLLIQFGEGDKPHLDAYHPKKISLLSAVDIKGNELAVKPKHIGEASVIVEPQQNVTPSAIFYTIAYDDYIIKGEDWIKSTPEEAADAEKSWSGSYTSTSILKWNDTLVKALQRSIEIVPLVNPNDLKKGDRLSLQIFRYGKPLPEADVYLGGDKKSKSDQNGKFSVPIKGGHQVIIASVNEENNNKTTFFGATISFTHTSSEK